MGAFYLPVVPTPGRGVRIYYFKNFFHIDVTFNRLNCLVYTMKIDEFKNKILPLRDKLFRLALRMMRNQEDAEDVVQEVMLKMWDIRSDWEKIENKEAYCCRMVRNISLGKIDLKDYGNETLDEHWELRLEDESPGEKIEKDDNLRWLHELIARLSEKQRTVVQLRDIEGMSYREIAVCMAISEEQVKVTLFRARKEIREMFFKIDGYGLRKN